MLFAVSDYVQYRRQWGRYSVERLERKGWKLAAADNFEFSDAPEPADFFLMHTRDSALSWLVMYVSNYPGSHTGLFGYGGAVIDATTAGVIEHPFSDYLDGHSYIIVVHSSQDTDAAGQRAAVSFAQSKVGTPYGWGIAARMAAATILGARDAPPSRGHWRLWVDVLVLLALATSPRRLFRGWPNIFLRVGIPYVGVLALTRPQARRRSRRLEEAAALRAARVKRGGD